MPVVSLLYHQIRSSDGEADADPHRISVSAARFAAQMECLAARFTVVPLAEVLAAPGRFDEGRYVAITFDDAYQGALNLGVPTLEKHGLPATFFVPTAHPGSGRLYWWDALTREEGPLPAAADLMKLRYAEAEASLPGEPPEVDPGDPDLPAGWEQLARLDPRLFDLGCHGHRHSCFAALSVEELAGELGAARERLLATGLPVVRAVAYPFGFPGSVTVDQVREAVALHFEWGLTSSRGRLFEPAPRDPFFLDRFYAENLEAGELEAVLDRLFERT